MVLAELRKDDGNCCFCDEEAGREIYIVFNSRGLEVPICGPCLRGVIRTYKEGFPE